MFAHHHQSLWTLRSLVVKFALVLHCGFQRPGSCRPNRCYTPGTAPSILKKSEGGDPMGRNLQYRINPSTYDPKRLNNGECLMVSPIVKEDSIANPTRNNTSLISVLIRRINEHDSILVNVTVFKAKFPK